MVFNSVHFLVFFVVVYGPYRLLPHRAQNVLLLAASYYFYAAWDWRFLGLLVGSTLVDFTCARVMAACSTRRARRAALAVSLGWNLSVLGFFKYFNFFADNLAALFAAIGWRADFFTLHVLLPIGISFYTFITIGYVVDVYRRQFEATKSLLDYAIFLAYFPHLVAGPILRASQLLPQIARPRAITAAQVREGLWLIGWGFFKKMVVADNLARVVDRVFHASADPSGLEVLIGLYAFAFQVYGDFSGYTDIARGTSKLMGIELSVNFRFPYFVRTPAEFWQHWHITLSSWLRDYLFLPISYALSRRLDGVRWLGLRDEFWIYAGGTMATMLLGGLWHGAAWTFVLWGAYQGLLLVGFRAWRMTAGRRKRGRRRARSPVASALGVAAMFHLTCLGWLLFRAGSLGQVASLAGALFGRFDPSWGVVASEGSRLVFYAGPLLAIHAFEARHDDLAVVFRWPPPVRYAVYAALAYFIVLFGNYAGAQFIYFQF